MDKKTTKEKKKKNWEIEMVIEKEKV